MASISSPGIGSNLDVNGIVSKLMAVESQPLTTLQKKEASYQAKLTAFGSIKGALSSFQNAISSLTMASTFQVLSAASSDSSVLTATAASNAIAGNYAVNVTGLAQSQTISSAGQASTTSSIGTGASTTLTFQFGTISGGTLTGGVYTGASFSQDTTQSSAAVVIDSSNNSLQGIRDAINAAKIGVTASIVNDGDPTSPYHLMLTSNATGQARSMKITSSGGDAAVTNLLAYDPAGTQNFKQTTAAQNATLTVNGLAITSATNAVAGAIPGVTLNVTKVGAASLSLSNNTAAVTSAVQGLVKSYNDLNSTLTMFTSYNPKTKSAGMLLGDSGIQSIQTRLRATLGGALSGLGGSTITNISQVGIAFQKDGTLTVDNAKLQTALSTNFGDFASLFAANGKTTDSLVNFVDASAKSAAGSYNVEVTSLATQGRAVGTDAATQAQITASTAPNLTITAGVNDKLMFAIDGAAAVPVTLTAGNYADANALAAQVQTDINTALAAAVPPGAVTVTQSGGKLVMTSNKFGAASGVTVSEDPTPPGTNTGAADLLGIPTTSRVTTIKAGVNDTLSLTIDGVSATVTLAAGTYNASGLAAQLQATANSATAFTAANKKVTVTEASGVLTMSSNSYGSSSMAVVNGGNAITSLFGGVPTATTGADIVGKINGVAATGSGQFLTGAPGDASEGVRVQVAGGSTGVRGTVSYSQGYAYKLNAALTDFLAEKGVIANSTDNTNQSIADLTKRADALNLRLTALEKQYRAQFTRLDTLIGSLSATSSYLTQQLSALQKSTSS
ncbi:flagellar hook protein FliD [Oxalobacteraceae bacterium OM1]|nr:flagellar hook protein FliD [Oxalobacteraceae bacterium OM1]